MWDLILLLNVGTATGAIGTVINAFFTNLKLKIVAFIIWIISALCIIEWALGADNIQLMLLNCLYLCLAVIGIVTHVYRVFVKDSKYICKNCMLPIPFRMESLDPDTYFIMQIQCPHCTAMNEISTADN